MKAIAIITMLTIFSVSITACGKQGDLERPGPMWGDKSQTSDG